MESSLMATIFEWAVSIGMTVALGALFTIWLKVKELHQWHAKEDDEGVKVWYTRNKNMEDVLEKMGDVIDRMDRREERALLIQNETIRIMNEHTTAITKLVAVVESLVILTKRNGK